MLSDASLEVLDTRGITSDCAHLVFDEPASCFVSQVRLRVQFPNLGWMVVEVKHHDVPFLDALLFQIGGRKWLLRGFYARVSEDSRRPHTILAYPVPTPALRVQLPRRL